MMSLFYPLIKLFLDEVALSRSMQRYVTEADFSGSIIRFLNDCDLKIDSTKRICRNKRHLEVSINVFGGNREETGADLPGVLR